MVKSKQLPVGGHEHCDKCYSVHCQAPDQSSVSCMVIKCRKSCGAVLHKCKQEEHQLLCPNEAVPCLNAHYGCPFTMLRHRLAEHLEVCPASVVCCSQEWSRWPLSETDLTCRNLSEDLEPEPHLDVAVALRDQELLFRSIKMKNVFPELMMEDLQDATSGVNCPAEEAGCSSDHGKSAESPCTRMEVEELGQKEKAPPKSRDIENIHNFGSWEKIFTKERGGCEETVKNLNRKEGEENEQRESSNCQGEARNSHLNRENAAAVVASSSGGATGFAPWQDGVLERLGREVNMAEYHMYLRQNGAMLINFGQLAACTPRDKDFVYGKLEPIEVQTVRSFKVPTSFRAKRVHMSGPVHKARHVHTGVDTADLGVPVDELPKCDEISATLLCSLEKEVRGHVISETKGVDGLYVDVGTQTYDFRSAPFKAGASLADVVADKPPGLYIHVEAECVSRRHNKTNSAFTHMCGHFFRRDEYRSHFRNVHSDIQASLGGWLLQRCPLAYLGCTFAQTRLQPAGHQAAIKFCRDVSAFVLQPLVASSLCEGGKTLSPRRSGARDLDPLSRLPLEVLRHVAGYLDSFTLSQLSQASRLMRELCTTLLQARGMVSLKWVKKTYSHGGSAWRCRKKVWEFSSGFSSVDRWSFSSVASMSDHLKTCSFYLREERTEPVVLAGLREVREKHGEVKQQR
ncbi:F-box only protein 40 [Platichthys flesus]|uniref:F-box only protein 40 n=1 Tax=Platichthys flesus TaxID=8260 RepID=UPI002DBF0259|nr:F-box only protein 40 [Platichthys flesus]